MSDFDAELGRTVRARLVRQAPPGAYLAIGEDAAAGADEVLLPRGEVPDGAAVGDVLAVFLYRDSEDRPTATLRRPAIELGDVAFLPVVDVGPLGAFVAWGLTKDLLVPHAEQTRPLRVGERHPIGLYVDRSGRLAGTMRIREMLVSGGAFREGAWIEGEAWRKEPGLGIFVILEKHAVGLLPEAEPSSLARGERARFRVARALPDGKLELSLREAGAAGRASDVDHVLTVLSRPGAPALGDRSPPERVAEVVGLSKKAFKRAVGALLREGRVRLDERGDVVVVREGG